MYLFPALATTNYHTVKVLTPHLLIVSQFCSSVGQRPPLGAKIKACSGPVSSLGALREKLDLMLLEVVGTIQLFVAVETRSCFLLGCQLGLP